MWFAEAPSNIALVKYMGKKGNNIPCNTSLSFTLDKLMSRVEMYEIDDEEDKFEPLEMVGFLRLDISRIAIERFKNHLKFLKNFFECNKNFLIKSGNNFPNDVGIASSASSFAALTKCVVNSMIDLKKIPPLSTQEMSKLSRIGSGSSCRSFFSPWAIWENEYAEQIDLPYNDLIHKLCLIDTSRKKISSGDAHIAVSSSLLFSDRPRRANLRVKQLIEASLSKDWEKMFEIVWADFYDMHAMFETCDKPFGYITPETLRILSLTRNVWEEYKDGPIVTVDAGPNVHLLWRRGQEDLISEFESFCDCEVV